MFNFSNKSIKEWIVIKVEAIFDVANDAAFDEMSTVHDPIEMVPSKSNFKKPLDKIRTLKNNLNDVNTK